MTSTDNNKISIIGSGDYWDFSQTGTKNDCIGKDLTLTSANGCLLTLTGSTRKYVSTRGAQARLHLACVAGFLFPISMFMFAWSATSTVPWAVLVVALTVCASCIFRQLHDLISFYLDIPMGSLHDIHDHIHVFGGLVSVFEWRP